MAKDVAKFQQAANILQQVDVSEIFTALALGIADAQKKLDDHSIAQVIRLSQHEIAGKSLLELGFVPAFYSFTYADISASINLKMALKESFEFGIGLNAQYESGGSQSTSASDRDSQQSYQREKSDFRSNRRFAIKSSSQQSISVNNNHYRLDQSLGIVSKIEKLHTEIIQQEEIERLNVNIRQPLATRYVPSDQLTVLKLTDYNGNDVDSTGDGTNNVIISGHENLGAAFPGTAAKYGFSRRQMFGVGSNALDMEVYFGFDKRMINAQYHEGPVDNRDGRMDAMAALADVLRVDPDLKATIYGHTDSSGPNSYNDNLSTDRCEAMRNWLVARGARLEQIQIKPQGERLANEEGPDNTPNPIYRKVNIVLDIGKDYVYYDSALNSPQPAQTDGQPNFFIVPASNPDPVLINADSESAFNSLTESETIDNVEYKLDGNTEIEFFAYSNTSESIELRTEEGAEEEIRISENESRRDQMRTSGSSSDTNRTFAIGGSIDFRMSKQFEMSMEGNASMSARMVAAPPPTGLLDHINEQLKK